MCVDKQTMFTVFLFVQEYSLILETCLLILWNGPSLVAWWNKPSASVSLLDQATSVVDWWNMPSAWIDQSVWPGHFGCMASNQEQERYRLNYLLRNVGYILMTWRQAPFSSAHAVTCCLHADCFDSSPPTRAGLWYYLITLLKHFPEVWIWGPFHHWA